MRRLPRAMCQTVTRRRQTQTGTDVYGQPVYTVAETEIDRCNVQPWAGISTTEGVILYDAQTQLASGIESRWRLFTPPDADLNATDEVVTPDGLTLMVDGDPQLWRDARGRPHHYEVYLKRRTG